MGINILVANYGNASLAMIEWAIESKLENVMVLSVNTNWHSEKWQKYLLKVFKYLKANNIAYKHLKAPKSFAENVIDRGSFPSKKFQWCAPFLKGLILNEALDDLDLNCQATVHLAKIKINSRANQDLISGQDNENYQGRILNYPLLNYSLSERDQLIVRAGFKVLENNSSECMPCIHSDQNDLQRMSNNDITRLNELELQVNQKMFVEQPEQVINSSERYDMGCGNIWGCGE